MRSSKTITAELAGYLDSIAEKYRAGHLDSDPIGIVRSLSDPADLEVGAFLASVLALGRVATIRSKTEDLFRRFEGRPSSFLRNASSKEIRKSLYGFRHRFYGEDDVAELALRLRDVQRDMGSLEAAWGKDASFEVSLDSFARRFRDPSRTNRVSSIPLVPTPAAGSTCKRLLMFLRWVVRPDDGVDLGLWKIISPSRLVIPMDTHIFRISRLLGLTSRRTPNWKAAVEVTERLRAFDPADPVKYDFALSRIGIVQGCRAKYVARICDACPLLPVCEAAKHRGSGSTG